MMENQENKQSASSLPAIGAAAPATTSSAGSSARQARPSGNATAPVKSKYSLNADSRDSASMKRAQHYVQHLIKTAPARAPKDGCSSQSGQAAARSLDGLQSTTPSIPPPPPPAPTALGGPKPFYLSPAESYVVAQKEATMEKWRSTLLKHEADLRELVITSSTSMGEGPPSASRIVKTLKIYDAVCRASEEHSPNLAEMLRLFRVEFCRAIFANLISFGEENGEDDGNVQGRSATGSQPRCIPFKVLADPALLERISEDEVTTYFDQVGSLVRENALLSADVAVGNSRMRMVELTKEVESLRERIKLYEGEIERLARQNDQVLEQCNKARAELVESNLQHDSKILSNEKELQALNVENKDLQLQLFRLRKQVAGGKSKQLKDAYRQMKKEKTHLLTTLFSEGDERMAVLVMLSQLESRLNEILDRYDNDFMLSPVTEHVEVRRKMGEDVTVLLEEIHLCQKSYRRLVPLQNRDPTSEETDETDGYVAILFDQKIYENLLTREAIQQRLQRGAELLAQEELTGTTTSTEFKETRRFVDSSLPVGAKANNTALVSVVDIDGHVPPPEGSGTSHGGSRGKTDEVASNPFSDHSQTAQGKVSELFLKSSFTQIPDNATTSRPSTRSASQHVSQKALTVPSTQSSRVSFPQGTSTGVGAVTPELDEVLFLKRADWVERIFSIAPQEQLMRNIGIYVANQAGNKSFLPCTLMPRLLRNPLLDISSGKFLSAIDVFCGRDPLQQRRLCTITHVDPAIPIQLPERTQFMKVKYRSSNAPPALTGNIHLPTDAPAQGGTKRSVHAGTRTQPRRITTSSRVEDDRDSVVGGGDERSFFMTATGEISRLEGAARPSQTQSRQRGGGGDGAAADRAAETGKQLKDWGGSTAYNEETPGDRTSGKWGLDGQGGSARGQVPVVGRENRTVAGGSVITTVGGAHNNSPAKDAEADNIFNVNENLRVFRELTNPALMRSGRSDTQKAGATSSTTATTVAFQRLNPLSPNRGPEWSVYKTLFGGLRSLTPRMIEVTTIDHILMSTCERHFTRAEYRYDECRREAKMRATNSQMCLAMAERFFREAYELSDFQEALIDELEARYCFPELVAKTLYEILCYLDAMAYKDELLDLYLNVIRGFQPPTHLHYTSYMLFHLSYCWPTSNPNEEISHDDALTVLRYLYRKSESIVHVDIHEVLRDFQMASRSAPLTFVTMRKFMASTMMHQEECLLLYLNGLFSSFCECESLDQLSFENYESVASQHWYDRAEQKSIVRFLVTGLGLDRGALLTVKDLATIASSEWCSNLWR